MVQASLGYSCNFKLVLDVTFSAGILLVIVFKYNTHEGKKVRELGRKNRIKKALSNP